MSRKKVQQGRDCFANSTDNFKLLIQILHFQSLQMAHENKKNYENNGTATTGGKGDDVVKPTLNSELDNKEKGKDGKNNDHDVMIIKNILGSLDNDGKLARQIKQCLDKERFTLIQIAGGDKKDLTGMVNGWKNDIDLPQNMKFRNVGMRLVNGFFNLQLNQSNGM